MHDGPAPDSLRLDRRLSIAQQDALGRHRIGEGVGCAAELEELALVPRDHVGPHAALAAERASHRGIELVGPDAFDSRRLHASWCVSRSPSFLRASRAARTTAPPSIAGARRPPSRRQIDDDAPTVTTYRYDDRGRLIGEAAIEEHTADGATRHGWSERSERSEVMR